MSAPGKITWLSKRRLEALLDTLETAPSLEAYTLTLAPGTPLDSIRPATPQQVRWLDEVLSLAAERIAASDTGAVLFWSQTLKLLVIPPFPLSQSSQAHGLDAGPLWQLMRQEYTLGVVLLRLGRYSVGVFRGDRLLTSKTNARYVKGRHRAGGSSQRRFQRIREKQIHNLFARACEVVAEQFGPYERELDYVLLGGERHTLRDFLKECDYSRRMKPLTLKRTLPIGEPKHRELQRMPREIWKSPVCFFQWPEGFPFQGLG